MKFVIACSAEHGEYNTRDCDIDDFLIALMIGIAQQGISIIREALGNPDANVYIETDVPEYGKGPIVLRWMNDYELMRMNIDELGVVRESETDDDLDEPDHFINPLLIVSGEHKICSDMDEGFHDIVRNIYETIPRVYSSKFVETRLISICREHKRRKISK